VGIVFAPSWRILSPMLKARTLHTETEAMWLDYVDKYTEEMRGSIVTFRPVWKEVLTREVVTLVCYCTDPARCHRTVLAGFLGKCGAKVMGERDEKEG
jgi:uncharacterized protein YeaO (DUF488 family)